MAGGTPGWALAEDSPSGPPKLPGEAFPLPDAPSKAVKSGFLAGAGSVSSSGAFTYQVPLEVPAGRGGVQPSLSLDYSSQGGDGIVGLGWAVSGMSSSITRCGKRLDSDGTTSGVNFDEDDRYCLDGQELVALGASEPGGDGAYGGDKTEYRTEKDSFAKIVSTNDPFSSSSPSTGPDTFVVASKNGLISTYKPRSATRVLKKGINLVSATDAGACHWDTSSDCVGRYEEHPDVHSIGGETSNVRALWTLDSVRDQSGNEMTYSYTPTTGAAGNEFLLDHITYTNIAGHGGGQRQVKFVYENRTDTSFSYVNGVRYNSTKRLSAIEMWAPYPATVKKVRDYHLFYKPMSAGEQRHSLLESIQECGLAGGCVPKKVFAWSAQPDLTFTPTTVDGSAGSGLPTSGSPDEAPPTMKIFDFNGDGADDVVYQKSGADGQRARWSTRDTWGQVKPLDGSTGPLNGTGNWPGQSGFEVLGNFESSRPLDMNNDGKHEIAINVADLSGFSLKIVRWDSATNTFVNTGQKFSGAHTGSDEFADMNGDGWLDHVGGYIDPLPANGPGESGDELPSGISVNLNMAGDHFAEAQRYPVPNMCANGRVLDINGDGRAEVLLPSAVTVGGMASNKGVCGVSHVAPGSFTPTNTQNLSWGSSGGGTYMVGTRDDGSLYGDLSPIHTAQEIGEFNSVLPVQTVTTELECILWRYNKYTDTWDCTAHVPHFVPYTTYKSQEMQNGLYPWKPVIGDYNGDGLKDVVLVPIAHRTQEPLYESFYPLVFLWNTGAGVDWDNATSASVTIPRDALADVQARDVDGDGRDDLVSFWNTNLSLDKGDLRQPPADRPKAEDWTVTAGGEDRISVMLSKGDGTFSTKTMNVDAGSAHAGLAGRPLSNLGDFNGDGLTDIITVGKTGGMVVRSQQDKATERIVAVSDEGANWSRQVVDYQHWRWDGRTSWDGGSCTGRAMCMRTGGTLVVKSVSSHEGATSAEEAKPEASVLTFYDFRDPVADRFGRLGLIGFGVERRWTPGKPVETKTLFNVRTTSPDVKRFPFAGMPLTTFTVVPILKADQVASHPTGTVRARVTRVDSGPEYRPLNANKTYAAFPGISTTKEWEQDVTIDWDPSLLTNPAHTHNIIGVDNNHAADRTRTVTTTVDDLGNTTHVTDSTAGGVSTDTDTVYDLSPDRLSSWLTGLPKSTSVTTTENKVFSTVHTSYTHDEAGLLTDTTVEDGNADKTLTRTSHLDRNGTGQVIKTTTKADGLPDRVCHTEYDTLFPNQPDEDIYASQNWCEHDQSAYRPSTWQAVHPALGIPVATMTLTQAGSGVATLTQIDDLGRPTSATVPGQRTVTTSYSQTTDADGGVTGAKVTTSNGATTSTTSTDPAGRTRTGNTTGFNGETLNTTTTYDAFGRAVTQSRPYTIGATPKLASTLYDSLDRVVKSEAPDKSTVTNEYNGLFETLTTDARGHLTESISDLDGRPHTSSVFYQKDPQDPSPSKATTTYAYTPTTTTVTDDQGNVTKTTTDILGRTTKAEDPDRGTTTTNYYGTGDIDTVTHTGTGDYSTYHYDDLGRTTSRTDHDNVTNTDGTTKFTWDTASHGLGQLASATSPDKIITGFRYDSIGRTVGTDTTDTTDLTQTTYSTDTSYTVYGTPDTLAYPNAPGRDRFTLKNTYNTRDYLTGIQDYSNPAAPQTLQSITDMNADLAVTNATLGTHTNLTNTYDPDSGRLTDQNAATPAGTPRLQQHYDYYPDGQVKQRVRKRTGDLQRTEDYRYDEFNRLTGWDLTLGTNPGTRYTTTYGFDTIGNLTGVDSNINQTTVHEAREYGKNNPDAATRHIGPHALGHIDRGPVEAYTYDARGRMTKNEQDDGTQEVTGYTAFDLPKSIKDLTGKTTTFAYDAFGQRFKKTGPDGTTVYIGGLFEKRTDKANQATYVYLLPGIGQAVYKPGTGTNLEYTLTDAQGSTGLVLDSTGTATSAFYYDPYGARINPNGTPAANLSGDLTRGFQGNEHDDALRLINNNGRLYDPVARTFLTPDPAPYNHAYTYANSNPVNFTDPTGYDPVSDLGSDVFNAGATLTQNYGTANDYSGFGTGIRTNSFGQIQDGFTNPFANNAGSDNTAFASIIKGINDSIDEYNAIMNTPLLPLNEGGDPFESIGAESAHGLTNPPVYLTVSDALDIAAIVTTTGDAIALADFVGGMAEADAFATALDGMLAERKALQAESFTGMMDLAKVDEFNRRAVNGVAVPMRFDSSGIHVEGTRNCEACAIAGDSTLGGSPAQAVGNLLAESGSPVEGLANVAEYAKSRGGSGVVKSVRDPGRLFQVMSDQGPGARAIVGGWGARGNPNHFFNVINEGGRVYIWDFQLRGNRLPVDFFGRFNSYDIIMTTPPRIQ
ncbi:VCBS repeat-containing protein [Streptomyces sp. SKN60]|uniref:FG-GAP-like repeat-containing protein n=1 Tax=Streptomyces sp. SKN60 TaxID=2855506 RepID=UPI0022485FBD|nr:FG-GAP-like repeat-containing protein [Streptomyces sp. SKN60]MCX2185691.1 VCBS repeat-containing protein [Streptomyces sp. SKN60]